MRGLSEVGTNCSAGWCASEAGIICLAPETSRASLLLDSPTLVLARRRERPWPVSPRAAEGTMYANLAHRGLPELYLY